MWSDMHIETTFIKHCKVCSGVVSIILNPTNFYFWENRVSEMLRDITTGGGYAILDSYGSKNIHTFWYKWKFDIYFFSHSIVQKFMFYFILVLLWDE